MSQKADLQTCRNLCLDLIQNSRVMTLSTCGNGNQDPGSWSAPVYYLFRDKCFYFFSNPESRHILEGVTEESDKKTAKNSAASIFRDAPEFTDLEGLQMSGRIFCCPWDKNTITVALAYCNRFEIQVESKKILEYFSSRFHARLYKFMPENLYYMNNDQGIGTRNRVDL